MMARVWGLRFWICAIAFGLGMGARESEAQATYVGTFALTNAATIKCLTNPNDSSTPGEVVVGNPWAATLSQQWAFFLLPNGYFAIMNVKNALFLENVEGLGPGATQQKPWNAGLGQQWYLYPFGDNFYALVNVRSGFMLTDSRNTNASGQRVHTNSWVNGLNQRWHLYFLRY